MKLTYSESPRWSASWPSPRRLRPRPRPTPFRLGPAAPAARCSRRWNDNSSYTLAANGDLEAGGLGWTLNGGAAVVPGGDPFALGGKVSAKALSLPAGSSATVGAPTASPRTRRRSACSPATRARPTPSSASRSSSARRGRKESKVVGDITAGCRLGARPSSSRWRSDEAGDGHERPVPLHAAGHDRPLADRLGLHRPDHAPVAVPLAGPPPRAAALRPTPPPSRARRSARAPCRRAGGPGRPA